MIKAVIFDFDGIIIDSNPTTISYFQETMRHFNLPIPSKKDFEPLWSLTTQDMIKKLISNYPEDFINKVYEYSRTLSVKCAPFIPPVPHALEVIRNLHQQYKLGLVTSRGKKTTHFLVKKYHLDNYLKVIIDREDVTHHKPHPEPILKAINKIKVSKKEVFYIGDARVDIDSSHRAGIPCVLISPSHKKYQEDYWIKSIKDLPSLLNKINHN